MTTAEGIEDEQTLAKLRELGVHRGQGDVFARPCPANDSQPPDPVVASSTAGGEDPIAIVRALFGAFADRDLVRARQLCHPALILRPLATSSRADRPDAYRGHDGPDQYFRDVAEVWDQLRLVPTAFWQANHSVIVFGQAIARVNHTTRKADALWVYRLRDGLSPVSTYSVSLTSRKPRSRQTESSNSGRLPRSGRAQPSGPDDRPRWAPRNRDHRPVPDVCSGGGSPTRL